MAKNLDERIRILHPKWEPAPGKGPIELWKKEAPLNTYTFLNGSTKVFSVRRAQGGGRLCCMPSQPKARKYKERQQTQAAHASGCT